MAPPGPQMEQQRIARRLGMLRRIPGRVEPGMGIIAARRAVAQIMQQRMQLPGVNLRVMRAVPGAGEERIGIAPFGQAEAQEMPHRIEARHTDIGVAVLIPIGVAQQAEHRLQPLGGRGGGFGARRARGPARAQAATRSTA